MGWHLRRSEWLSSLFFAYIAVLAPFFRSRPHLHLQPLALAALVLGLHSVLAWAERCGPQLLWSRIRDWTPILVTLVAFQEMDLFQPSRFPHFWEPGWILQDKWLLIGCHFQRLIEGAGPVFPFYLETCYLLVYGIAATAVGILYVANKRRLVDNFYLFYFTATLGAYALFPYFPSEPPRFLFPDVAPPTIVTAMRLCNLDLLRKATIHVSVFPSAHVSSAFSAGWALLYLLPQKPILGGLFVAYGASVAVATIYGRYHYTADAVAGFVLSCVAFAMCCWYLRVEKERRSSPAA